ncbi:MAG: FtsQ-type POTRA domain-containing protein [Proteobacteria bacterium]|nr:FtsQ-type POTRA domain-containing protein [Pseudomonadota bacterium]
MERLRPVAAFAWVLGSVALAAALYAGVRAGAGFHPFVLQSIGVEGTRRATPEEVIRSAGLTTGVGLFQVDVERVRRLVEGLPWVRRARVVRQLPSTLLVEVEEWEPRCLVRLDRLYYLTPEAHVVRAPLDQGLDYPVITGLGWADLEAEGPARLTLLELLALLEKGALGDEASEIHADPEEGFTVYTPSNGGTGIRVGRDGLEEKLRRLARLRRHLAKRGQAAYCVDLAGEDKIVARLMPGGTKGARP